MEYQAQDYSYLLGNDVLNDELLKNHFTLYEGYVKNTNELIKNKNGLIHEGKSESSEFSEINRRFGWEFNGMRLHEYYFENMVPEGSEIDHNSELFKKMTESFGSYQKWESEFRSIAKIRGIGWVVLYYDVESDHLHNVWVGEHNINHLAGAIPLLVLDVWEHAYMKQYGLQRADYVDDFFKVIDWEEVTARFGAESSEEIAETNLEE